MFLVLSRKLASRSQPFSRTMNRIRPACTDFSTPFLRHPLFDRCSRREVKVPSMVWRGQDSGHGLDLHILDSAEELLEHGAIPSQACWAIELFYGVMASVMLQGFCRASAIRLPQTSTQRTTSQHGVLGSSHQKLTYI